MKNDLGELAAFAVVAEERSFTRAAARLGISQSALSHSMRGLEKRLGLQLLARTTRSVSPTAAGAALLQDLTPALERIERSLAEARKRRESPTGRIRLIIPRPATYMVLLPKLARFARTYPEIVLEVTSSNDPVDLVAGEYDAGVQIGEFIQRDMIAVRVSKDLRLAVVGSPEYFKSHKIPRTPRDLKDHACIGFRFSSGIYRWEFEKGRKALTVNPQGPATFDDPDLVVQAVLNGVGIATTVEQPISEMIAKGRLVQVLRDWCPTFPGYFLYYPSRRNQPAALAALINTLRLSD
ncbi:LysR family transcriptional regulator [Terriglobus albidus]|uniref:LysR family transcriptional regulator n=1 Tax=Terriglobus albidus TaxID=1592106 RepID=A0A5B9EER5_9BACT|nr:LysR family transcriptional regulator [Terriglobus albidus]QEE28797.1 LysR family transcriptional regulator [Terriglobus albidus]